MKYSLFLLVAIFSNAYAQSDSTTDEDGVATITTELATSDSATSESATTELATTDFITTELVTTELETTESPTTQSTTTQSTTTVTTTTEPTTTEPTTTGIPSFFLGEGVPYTWWPQSRESILVEVDEGYQIAVNVTKCVMDGENGEYATINTEDLTNGLTFTYNVTREPAYVYNTNRLFGEYYGTNASNFTAVFSRIGEPRTTTTTEIPSSTIYLPSPGEDDSSTLQVYLEGKTTDEFSSEEVEQQLREAIAQMAAMYCDNENFPLNGSITTSNVIIHRLGQCPMTWANSDKCAILVFAVPVNLMEDSDAVWTGYQMTTSHLKIMWSRYASTYLPGDISYYFTVDNSSLKWGLIIASAVVVVFIIALSLARYCGMKVTKQMGRGRKLSDTTSIISSSDRNSQTSLPPHYLQETPPLFENAYPMYNPDKVTAYTEPPYTNPPTHSPREFLAEDYLDLTSDIPPQREIEDEESGA